MDAFGSMAGALAASRGAQLKASGNDLPAVVELAAFRDAMLHALRQELEDRPIIDDDRALAHYLTAMIGHAPLEHVVALFLNARNVLLADERMFVGGVDAVQVPIREIVAKALEIGATGVILVHNHPSGDPTPTEDDRLLTRRMGQAFGLMQLRLVDHVIVSAGRTFSFRRAGVLS